MSESFQGQAPVIMAGSFTLQDLHRSRKSLLRRVDGFSPNNMEPRGKFMGGGVKSSNLSVAEIGLVLPNVYVSSKSVSFSLSRWRGCLEDNDVKDNEKGVEIEMQA